MPRIEVTTGAVRNAGAALARDGDQMTEVAATIASAGAGSAGIGDPAAAAAYQQMWQVWSGTLEQMAIRLASLGVGADRAAAEYLATDRSQMLTAGGGAP